MGQCSSKGFVGPAWTKEEIFEAVQSYGYDIIDSCIKQHRDLTFQNSEGQTLFDLAYAKGDFLMAGRLFNYSGIQEFDERAKEILLWAIDKEGYDLAQTIIRRFKDTSDVVEVFFCKAAELDKHIMIIDFLSKGYDYNQYRDIISKALQTAKTHGNYDSVKSLLVKKCHQELNFLDIEKEISPYSMDIEDRLAAVWEIAKLLVNYLKQEKLDKFVAKPYKLEVSCILELKNYKDCGTFLNSMAKYVFGNGLKISELIKYASYKYQSFINPDTSKVFTPPELLRKYKPELQYYKKTSPMINPNYSGSLEHRGSHFSGRGHTSGHNIHKTHNHTFYGHGTWSDDGCGGDMSHKCSSSAGLGGCDGD